MATFGLGTPTALVSTPMRKQTRNTEGCGLMAFLVGPESQNLPPRQALHDAAWGLPQPHNRGVDDWLGEMFVLRDLWLRAVRAPLPT